MGLLEQLVERLDRLEHELSELRTSPTEPAAVWGDGAMRLIDAVKFSGLSRNELYSLMGAGDLPFFCTGRHRVVPRRALVRLLESKQHAHEPLEVA